MDALESATTMQVIVIRRDLNMKRDKELEQEALAIVLCLNHRIREPGHPFTNAVRRWLDEAYTRVCVRVDSQQELSDVYHRAWDGGVLADLCQDWLGAGYRDVPTTTCCAEGPDPAHRIDPITAHREWV